MFSLWSTAIIVHMIYRWANVFLLLIRIWTVCSSWCGTTTQMLDASIRRHFVTKYSKMTITLMMSKRQPHRRRRHRPQLINGEDEDEGDAMRSRTLTSAHNMVCLSDAEPEFIEIMSHNYAVCVCVCERESMQSHWSEESKILVNSVKPRLSTNIFGWMEKCLRTGPVQIIQIRDRTSVVDIQTILLSTRKRRKLSWFSHVNQRDTLS